MYSQSNINVDHACGCMDVGNLGGEDENPRIANFEGEARRISC
jgi:hypothetical protein